MDTIILTMGQVWTKVKATCRPKPYAALFISLFIFSIFYIYTKPRNNLELEVKTELEIYETSALSPFERAKLFHSPECNDFYVSKEELYNTSLPITVWENRSKNTSFATDAVICPNTHNSLVYVDNVKAGSTTVQALLWKNLRCSWTQHKIWASAKLHDEKCKDKKIGKCRSTTFWLDDRITSDYFFFSVVREPLDRFISGYKQALFQDQSLRNLTVSGYIQKYRYSVMNEHTQTQARRLGGRDANGNQVPMHFIASLENLEEDLLLLWKHLGLEPFDKIPKLRTASKDAIKNSLTADLSKDDIKLLCEHLMQDFVCFGYRVPEECLD